MEEEKDFLNKDLAQPKEKFYSKISNDFIGNDFEEQLEWGLLLVQNKFKQMRFANYMKPVYANHFDKAFLITATLNEKQQFFAPFTSLQVTPDIIPNMNIKIMNIGETISLQKYREIPSIERRSLKVRRKHAFELSYAFYKKDTDSFYAKQEGFELNPSFFNLKFGGEQKGNFSIHDLPNPISLDPNYVVPENGIKYLDAETIAQTVRGIAMAYNIALSMYYEWCIYIKDNNSIGFTIPIEPLILSDIFKTSMLKFENKKRMIHFVREHYRRKVANPNEDYSVFIQRYLRGEHKFTHNGFTTEIIPPRYDLNRVNSKKKFINPFS